MAESEVRQKFEAYYGLPVEKLMDSFAAWQEAYRLGMRAGEIARWIPVEEKLPATVNDEYLVCAANGVQSADWREGEWFTVRTYGCDSEERQLFSVTHWQPLPAAPEEKKPGALWG